jgi:hypothetical protein
MFLFLSIFWSRSKQGASQARFNICWRHILENCGKFSPNNNKIMKVFWGELKSGQNYSKTKFSFFFFLLHFVKIPMHLWHNFLLGGKSNYHNAKHYQGIKIDPKEFNYLILVWVWVPFHANSTTILRVQIMVSQLWIWTNFFNLMQPWLRFWPMLGWYCVG